MCFHLHSSSLFPVHFFLPPSPPLLCRQLFLLRFENGSAENRLAVREVCDSDLQRYYAMEQALANWKQEVRNRILSWWIGQLGVMAVDIRQAGISDMVEEKEILAVLLGG